MTTALLAFLIVGVVWVIVAIIFMALLLLPRREQKPGPMEYREPRVMTRILDGNNSTKEN